MEKLNASKTVFIVDDSLPIRERLVEMVDALENARVVGEAGTPRDAVLGILETCPDYVVLDFQLDGGTGVEVLKAVHDRKPGIVFIVLTNHAQQQFRRVCLDAGASAFLDKTTEFEKVKDLIARRPPAGSRSLNA